MARHHLAPDRSLIVHLIDSFAIGGRQILLQTVLQEMRRQAYGEHRVVSLFGDGPMGDGFRERGIPVDIFDLRGDLARKRPDRAMRRLTAYFREYRPEIVAAHLTYSRLIGLLAARLAGVPIRIAFEPGDIYLNSWKFRLANFSGQFWANRIVPCSHALAEWNHRTCWIHHNRMTVIHNCVDLERFDPSRVSAASEPFDRPACDTIYCAIGTLGTGVNKRVDVLIRALAEARAQESDVGLVIVGDGSLRRDLERLADELRMGDHVRFLGTRTDTPQILGACDALCHATPFEPFGIVVIEAMAMARPVIVPDSGGVREAVTDGITGLTYPPLDHHALALRMVRFHRNRGERISMGRTAREEAERRFSPRTYVANVVSLINEISMSRGK